jgi:PIN domain nuclease of toxin-antitoxin system
MNGIGVLALSLEHTAAISTLPFHHRDPFDRLIAVQARLEKMCLVSADPAFDAYEVQRVW